jgi:large subunit ribosomal protein L9
MAAVKVILRQDVPNLGHAGEIKQVAPGYYRNYLLPRGMAVEASKGQVNALKNDKAVREAQLKRGVEKAGTLAGELSQVVLRIPVKLGEQGRIYGSVTNADIADALKSQANVTVDRRDINLGEPLKTIGAHSIPVKLEHGVNATVQVELVPETETAS